MRALFAKKGTKSLATSYFGILEFFFEIVEKAFDIQSVDEFLVELQRFARLVGGQLPGWYAHLCLGR